jgi:hypothetical protein
MRNSGRIVAGSCFPRLFGRLPKVEADREWEVDFEEIAVDLLHARFGNLAVDLLRCELMA